MKNVILMFSCCLLISFTDAIGTWQEFKSLEGKFRVLTPTGDMSEKVTKMKTALGELEYHQFIYKPEDKKAENVFYLISYCDYPKGTFPSDSTELIQAFLQTTVESSAESVKGSIPYQSDIQQSGHKGKVWRVQYNNDNVHVKNKCFMAVDRFYLLQVMTLKQHSLNTSIDKFLDSFLIF